MSKEKNGNNSCSRTEKKITCRRCNAKFPIKVGVKNNGYRRSMNCPSCGTENTFWINEKGKISR